MTRRPGSIVSRMTWLVAGIGVLSLLLHLAVIWLWSEQIAGDLSHALSGRVTLARALLAATEPGRRDALARSLRSTDFTVERATGAEATRDPPIVMPGRILERLRSDAGGEFVVNLPEPPAGDPPSLVQFDFRVDGERWRASYQAKPPVAGLLGTAIGWFALLAIAVFMSLALGVRLIARPFAQLAARIDAQGDAVQPLAMPLGASRELFTVVAAFNRLANAVQRADETKQQMLAGVSHDLRTPLARLRLRIETQCDEPLAGALTADLQAIERIVSQFLAYVQGDGSAALGEADSVAATIRQVVGSYDARGAPVEAIATEHANGVEAQLPDLALQRVLVNLIDNALDHGAPPVRVELAQSGAAQSLRHELIVWDRGPGMSEVGFAAAQRPFVRLGKADTNDGHCGLGLAIVAQMARQVGATLAVRRDEARGFGIVVAWSHQR